MAFSLLITGGARSGKSSFAEKQTLSYGKPVIYIATAKAYDQEMEKRLHSVQESIQKEKQAAMESIKDSVASLSIEIAEKILEKKMVTDKGTLKFK